MDRAFSSNVLTADRLNVVSRNSILPQKLSKIIIVVGQNSSRQRSKPSPFDKTNGFGGHSKQMMNVW